METNDKAKFSRVLATLAEIYGRTLTVEIIAVYWSVLGNHPIAQIEQAARRYVESAKYFPTPAELLEYMPSAQTCRHIGADEAWAIVLASFDEFETVVMTQEMMDARKAVYLIWAEGDTVGARMAFREAYTRIVQIAGKPMWQVIVGFNAEKRLSAIESAKQLGRLSADYQPNQHILPAPPAEISFNQLLDMAEKNLDQADADSKKARSAAFAMMREILSSGEDGGVERRAKARQTFENHRVAELSKLTQKSGGLH